VVTLPLVAVDTLHASTFAVAMLTATAWLPWVLIGLPAGAWVDRLAKRPLMLACDVASFLLFASVPLAAWAGVLAISQLLAVALLAGVANVFFTTAYQAYLPILLEPGELTEGNAKMQASKSAAQVGGPGIGGAIAQLAGPVIGLLVNSVSFVVSAVCLLGIRTEEPARRGPKGRAGLRREISEGLRFLAGDPYLRPLTLYAAGVNVPLGGIDALLVVFLARTVGVASGVIGVVLALVGAGGLVGAACARRLALTFGSARTLLFVTVLTLPFGLLVPLTGAGTGVFLVAGYAVSNAGIVAFNVVNASFRQSYSPPELLGRVGASAFALSLGCVPLGAALGGGLGTLIGVRPTLWIMTIGLALSSAILVLSPLRRLRDLPKRPVRPEGGLAPALAPAHRHKRSR
jgi:predicted MFS family arabinose efflux permease